MTDKALSPLRRKDIETGRKLEREMLKDVIQYRISVYQQKRDKADPLADEIFNRHAALTYVIEALEIVEESLGDTKWNTSSALSSAGSGPSSVTSLDLTKE